MTSVLVNKIIPFSSVDGPGNRTAIFLQGCNIDCKYCHNPETRAVCIGCGLCVDKCPASALQLRMGRDDKSVEDQLVQPPVIWNPDKCVSCDTCIHICPHNSSPRVRRMSAEEVYRKVRRQIPYIRGVSVSGGECTLHPDFLTDLFRLAKADGLGTLIDSNGMVDFEPLSDLMEVTDGVMLDIKAFDRKQAIDVTGAPNDMVLKNAAFLGQRGKLEEVRFVIVPDLYDTEASVREAGRFLKPFYCKFPFLIKLIAFRPMGVRDRYKGYQVPSRDYLEYLRGILAKEGYEKIVLI